MQDTTSKPQATLGRAVISFDGERLLATTGRLARTWRWTGHGFLTESVRLAEDAAWSLTTETRDADWVIPVREGANPAARLDAVVIDTDDDEGFTARHVRASAEMTYPDVCLALRFVVWAYPEAPGLRMQLWVRGIEGFAFDGQRHRRETGEEARRNSRLAAGSNRVDFLPVDFAQATRRMIGYHSDTQNRNDIHLDLLHEVTETAPLTSPQVTMWANAMAIERNGWGLCTVKESHKCVNQRGHDTGVFVCRPHLGVECHGWGVLPQEIDGRWRPAWATWCLGYADDERSRQAAFKAFARCRYPFDEHAIAIQSNTWGSSQGWFESREAASEASVIGEVDSGADLGIEVLQIDDGWQGNTYDRWTPDPARYPQGWQPVREKAREKGLQLGLWVSGRDADLDAFRRTAEEGGFVSYKVDFTHLSNRDKIDTLMADIRALIKSCRHAVRVNWDLTEVTPRVGYFFAQEYGSVYLENRKPVLPRNAVYRPATVLRDLWQLSRYCNLMKFQGSVQDIDRVDPVYSDAAAYNHAYCVAITLMSSPLFFCETKLYREEARRQIRPLLEAYKRIRPELCRGMVFPIGRKPDGRSWTGFECALPEGESGYLLLFRELDCDANTGRFRLPHLAGVTLALEDVLSGMRSTVSLDGDGQFDVVIDRPADFRLYRYAATRPDREGLTAGAAVVYATPEGFWATRTHSGEAGMKIR